MGGQFLKLFEESETSMTKSSEKWDEWQPWGTLFEADNPHISLPSVLTQPVVLFPFPAHGHCANSLLAYILVVAFHHSPSLLE